jgi:hypothetical protein
MPSKHSCPICCESLSHLDAIIADDWKNYGAGMRWWRHPVWYFLIIPRIRDYAAAILDESGK